MQAKDFFKKILFFLQPNKREAELSLSKTCLLFIYTGVIIYVILLIRF